MWRISIHSGFDSLGGPLSPCGSHWLRLEPFTQIRSRTLCVQTAGGKSRKGQNGGKNI